jgi:hypothetical protein
MQCTVHSSSRGELLGFEEFPTRGELLEFEEFLTRGELPDFVCIGLDGFHGVLGLSLYHSERLGARSFWF